MAEQEKEGRGKLALLHYVTRNNPSRVTMWIARHSNKNTYMVMSVATLKLLFFLSQFQPTDVHEAFEIGTFAKLRLPHGTSLPTNMAFTRGL